MFATAGNGVIRLSSRVPEDAKVEFAYRGEYDSRGRVSVTPVVERGYSVVLTQWEIGGV